ncbi:MAG: AIR synthase related protein, partial [Candidatus Poseidonia sp.]|nr:AIR synthase related protein [Poseidonia sp.]
MSEPMDYASAGVDIDLEGSAVASLIGALSKSVRKPGTPGAPVDLPGGFGGLIEFGDNLLALATDGVGSKLQIATALQQWGGVGIDCMAMNVNDLLCVGAEPIAFVDYVAVPKPDPAIHAALGASLAEACRLARVTLAGGETASLPGIVTELDLSGTALGWLPKGQAITGEHLKEGDALIGLPASGIHSNGYSLVRKIIEHAGLSYTDTAPFEA